MILEQSRKNYSDEKVTLIEKDEIIKADIKTANILNISFATIINNPSNPEYQLSNSIPNGINDPVL